MNASYTKSSRALFIETKAPFFTATDKGIRWISDRYVLLRADLLKNPPKSEACHPLTVKTLRSARERLGKLLSGTIYDTGERPGVLGKPTALLTNGRFCVAVNLGAWNAWSETGLKPRLTSSGQVSWWADVQGREALFGIVMPIRLGRWVNPDGVA